MQQNFIFQFAYADMLIHARLAERHNIHSSAKAVLVQEIPPVQPCSILPGINHKCVPLD